MSENIDDRLEEIIHRNEESMFDLVWELKQFIKTQEQKAAGQAIDNLETHLIRVVDEYCMEDNEFAKDMMSQVYKAKAKLFKA